MHENRKNVNPAEAVIILSEIEGKTILPFYIYVAHCMGYTDSEVRDYDCRKIWIAGNILDAIIEAYRQKCPEEYSRNPDLVNQEIMMTLAMAGPKTDCQLADNHVRVEPGFITLKGEEVKNAEEKPSS